MTRPELRVDGTLADAEGLAAFAVAEVGHYTSMQVRGGGTRGLELHLDRLATAHATIFGTTLERDAVRAALASAIGDRPDATLRLTVIEDEPDQPHLLTDVRAPLDPSSDLRSLRPVPFVRAFAGLKHLATFPQRRFAEMVTAAGFDDALLVGPGGVVGETSVANVAFVDGVELVWPDAPVLRGVAWQLLDDIAAITGMVVRTEAVLLEELGRFDGALLANSIGVESVGRIGEHVHWTERHPLVDRLAAAYESLPLDPLEPRVQPSG